MAQLVTEWVKVTDDISIIARESGEVWFHTPSGTKEIADPFAMPMTGVGSAGSTVGLLDGAINLGFVGIEKRLARPEPTVAAYIVALVGAYHTSVDTPRNLRRAASRFNELGRPEVAAYLEERAREETGHDRLALKDLACAGCAGRAPRCQLHSGRHQAALQTLRRSLRRRLSDRIHRLFVLPGAYRRTQAGEPISQGFGRCARRASMRPASCEATAPSAARRATSRKQSNSSQRFLRVTASRSFRRPINRHCSWRRDIITNSSNPRRKCSRRFGRRSEKHSRMVVVQSLRTLKSKWLDLWRDRLAQSSSQSGVV